MKLNTRLSRRAIALVSTLLVVSSTVRADSFFMYQGRLKVGGANPGPSDRFDLRFSFFDAPSGTSPKLGEALVPAVAVDSNGVFTVQVDAWDCVSCLGQPQWLELAVRRTGGDTNYVTLTPRQRVAPVPTALLAQQSLTALSFTGMVVNAQLPATVARLDQPQVFTAPPSFMPPSGVPFTVGVTTTVQNLSADLLDGLDSTQFWRRETNGGVSRLAEPARLPFEVRVQNRSVLRLQEGNSNLGWSLVADPAINTIREGVAGSAVFGRGSLIESNADYSFVAGDGNQILAGARDSTISGGAMNRINPNGMYSGVFAGYGNEVNSRFAGVLLGDNGQVRESSDFSAVMSGENNTIGPQAGYSAIVAGSANQIQAGANVSAILSGQQNTISTQANLSAIVAGQLNQIRNGARQSFLGGGGGNEIGPASYNAFLGGGGGNQIQFNAPFSAILAGQNNLVRSNAGWSTVFGGVGSVAGAPFSIAAGHQAKAEHSGSIVLADGQYADFASSKANEFAVRAAGGVRFETGGGGLYVDGLKLVSGAGTVVTNGGNAETLDGFSSEQFWKLGGNGGTTAGPNFVGTTDNQALELKVQNQRALRLEPTVGSPNLIGGDDGNSVSSGVSGAAIGGGGSPGLFGVTLPNRVTDNFGVVAGGFNNRAGNDNADVQDSLGATVGGGFVNVAAAEGAIIGGGTSNTVQSVVGVIAGGLQNLIQANSELSSIGGGFRNTVQSNCPNSTIGGGNQNWIRPNTDGAVIAGGSGQLIESQTHWATVAGGFQNSILGQAYSASIGGGERNLVGTNAQFATIPGGADAKARDYGQFAYASGMFFQAGDAQTSIHVLRGTSTTSSPRELFLDGVSKRMQLPPGAVWTFDILVAATDGTAGLGGIGAASYQIRGAMVNLDGVIGILNTVKDVYFEGDVAWDVNVEGDVANSALAIKVVGSSNRTIRWVASVRTVEVVF